jgi:outer membrane lipoprotein SlyB
MGKARARSDPRTMNKKVLWMCMAAGSTIGGYLPTFIGQGSFSVASIVGSFVGGVAGVFAARSIDADF